jgi:cytochrome d ubiquinol oxidase subunit II
MTTLALMFIIISLLLYVVLGGAEYGAGIIELFTGNKGANVISKAIAPVWEANHIWLIVIIVILFNAFPEVYSTITLYLHIPLMLILFGIIFRGTAFAFRYYDPYKDRSHTIYTKVFQIFSILTPLFLGVTLGAVISGNITTDNTAGFYERFINPWLNLFPFALGIFMVVLFGFLAAVYLIGEPADEAMYQSFRKYALRLLMMLIIVGIIVFIAAGIDGLPLINLYLESWQAVLCVVFATVLIPFLYIGIRKNKKNFVRIISGAQTAAILLGWIAAQLPVLVELKGDQALTVSNSVATYKSVQWMVIALFCGLAVVIPLLIYLFRVFKFSGKE